MAGLEIHSVLILVCECGLLKLGVGNLLLSFFSLYLIPIAISEFFILWTHKVLFLTSLKAPMTVTLL